MSGLLETFVAPSVDGGSQTERSSARPVDDWYLDRSVRFFSVLEQLAD